MAASGVRSTLVLIIATFTLDASDFQVTDLAHFDFTNAVAEAGSHNGKAALHLTEKEMGPGASAVLKGADFRNGTIDVEVSGGLTKSADATARGFIGVVFHLQSDGSRCENIYIRPGNGRSDDQLSRNHSVQYISAPDFGWRRLREETPGKYESYADMQLGEWTQMRIVVNGKDASLYVGAAKQPSLVVKDMKLGETGGGVALWIGPGTDGYFRNLRITPAGNSH